MKSRPILFSGPMVRALLAGTKTQTRRIIPAAETRGWLSDADLVDSLSRCCRYGAPGDRLWVRETFAAWQQGRDAVVAYRASCENDSFDWVDVQASTVERRTVERWKPSIFMPRWASRITLKVTGVRVERLRDISEQDARAEGAEHHDGLGSGNSGWRHDRDDGFVWGTAKESFHRLWARINGFDSWDTNPWVWVVEFRRVEAKTEAA